MPWVVSLIESVFQKSSGISQSNQIKSTQIKSNQKFKSPNGIDSKPWRDSVYSIQVKLSLTQVCLKDSTKAFQNPGQDFQLHIGNGINGK